MLVVAIALATYRENISREKQVKKKHPVLPKEHKIETPESCRDGEAHSRCHHPSHLLCIANWVLPLQVWLAALCVPVMEHSEVGFLKVMAWGGQASGNWR